MFRQLGPSPSLASAAAEGSDVATHRTGRHALAAALVPVRLTNCTPNRSWPRTHGTEDVAGEVGDPPALAFGRVFDDEVLVHDGSFQRGAAAGVSAFGSVWRRFMVTASTTIQAK